MVCIYTRNDGVKVAKDITYTFQYLLHSSSVDSGDSILEGEEHTSL